MTKPNPNHDGMSGYAAFRDEMGAKIEGTSFWVVWRDKNDCTMIVAASECEECGSIVTEVDCGREGAVCTSCAGCTEGWYWAACYPGCMPDGDFSGPFASSRAAYRDALYI